MTLPRTFLITGGIWLLLSFYLFVAGSMETFEFGFEFPTPIGPLGGVVSLFGAVGLLMGRAFARGVILLAAGLGLIAAMAFLVTVPAASTWLWWALLVLAIFFAWSLFFVVALWSKRPLSQAAA